MYTDFKGNLIRELFSINSLKFLRNDNFSKIKNDYKIRIFEDDYTSKKMEGQYSL